MELDVEGAETPVPELVGAARPDLVLLNDDDLTYTKIRLDERSLQTLIAHIGDFTESLPRALCWTATWDMCRDAELPARDYIRMVLGGVAAEPDINVVMLLLRTANTAVTLYTDPARRDEIRREWADGLLRLAGEAEAGSDHQLTLVRAFAEAATTSEHASVLKGILTGETVYDGLAVDAELRWTLVQNLARLGVYGKAEIDAELERDNTIKGRESAALALAARPTAEAKQQAWYDAVHREDIANQTQLSTIRGFWQPGQEELLRPYVEQYLDAARWVWDRKANEMAQYVLIGLFPRLLATEETAAAVRSWLEREQPIAAVRRLVSEGLADVERALAAQAKDATA